MRPYFSLLGFFVLAGACAEGGSGTTYVAPPLSGDAGRRDGAIVGYDAGEEADGDSGDAGTLVDAAGEGGPDATVTDGSTVDGSAPSPVVDGLVGPDEYGVHIDGQNMQTSDVDAGAKATWFMSWDEAKLYVAVTSANVGEAVVLYLDTNPLTPTNGGGNGDGSLAGQPYDGTRLDPLPVRADFVAYVKSSYQEVRAADGTGGWSGPTTGAVTVTGSGNVRELAIPWTTIRSGGRPTSFAWVGYVTSSTGYAYAEMPPANPGGMVGTSAVFPQRYLVTDATPLTGSKPFAAAGVP